MVGLLVRDDPDLLRIHALAAFFFYMSILLVFGLLYKLGSGLQMYLDF